jgi:hypothetical protein
MVFSVGSAPRLYNEKFQGSSEFSEFERVQLKKGSFVLVVKNCFEILRLHSKVMEKK